MGSLGCWAAATAGAAGTHVTLLSHDISQDNTKAVKIANNVGECNERLFVVNKVARLGSSCVRRPHVVNGEARLRA